MRERPLVATYRFQLHAGFGFDDAIAQLDHLVELGVSHVYTSPVLAATPGSTHGYDVVDHDRVNDEIGGADGMRRLVEEAHARGLGVVVDIVPNHMAAHARNPAWWDLLRAGRSSAFADWFDVAWEHGSTLVDDRLLLPVLGDHYGAIVRDGQLVPRLEDGAVVLGYYERTLPLSEQSVEELRREAGGPAGAGGAGDPDGDAALERHLAAVAADPDRLHHLLEQQHYRLAHWTTGSEALDYRRFFDVTDLVGIRAERTEVFDASHALVLRWVADGDVDGLRIDHPDGLTDPTGYAEALRAAAGPDTWIIVEKILAPGEDLPDEWLGHVDGTTGYETLILIERLLVDAAGERALTEVLADHTGITTSFEEVRQDAKVFVIEHLLRAEIRRLADELDRHLRATRHRIDLAPSDAQALIGAFVVEFPVYRTYVRGGERADARDVAIIDQVRAAVHAHGSFDPAAVDAVADLLIGPLTDETAVAFRRRFQQTTGPAMAKGVEDTAFYRYPRLVSLNEVGGEPGLFGIALDEFHATQQRTAEQTPLRMITTSTHDTKRSEDVRARISVLSQVPDAWRRALDVFEARAAALGSGERDRVLEHLLHQTLVGAFPIDADRAVDYARKAAREAKRSTSWLQPDEEYEERLFDGVRAWLADEEYLAAVQELLEVIRLPGRVNALAAKLLALTLPGVPDLYQGTERWTDSLVDPDNRRPVDYELGRALVRDRDGGAGSSAQLDLGDDRGGAKLRLVRAVLDVRRRAPQAFAPGTGTYTPLRADGAAADHVVAYARGEDVVVVVPRATARLEADGGWRATRLELPAGRWSDAISGHGFDGSVAVADLLTPNPVALLVRV